MTRHHKIEFIEGGGVLGGELVIKDYVLVIVRIPKTTSIVDMINVLKPENKLNGSSFAGIRWTI